MHLSDAYSTDCGKVDTGVELRNSLKSWCSGMWMYLSGDWPPCVPRTSTICSSSGRKSALARCTFYRKTHLPSIVALAISLRTISV